MKKKKKKLSIVVMALLRYFKKTEKRQNKRRQYRFWITKKFIAKLNRCTIVGHIQCIIIIVAGLIGLIIGEYQS